MDKSTIEAKIILMLVELKKEKNIKASTEFKDLGMGFLDCVEFFLQVEKEFGIKFNSTGLATLTTPDQVAREVYYKLQ